MTDPLLGGTQITGLGALLGPESKENMTNPLEGLTLPIDIPSVFDSSTLSTFQRCPRKGFYQYGLHRSPSGVNYPIQFGQAYHKFRELIEKIHKMVCIDGNASLSDAKTQRMIYEMAFQKATEVTRIDQDEEGKPIFGWNEPDVDHRHSYLTKARLDATCNAAFDSWVEEKEDGTIKVLLWEQSFDLKLPNGQRYGGRFDQLVEWADKIWLRDFKTTSRMGKGYGQRFDPDSQMSGYIWGSSQLSGENVEGVSIEVTYNTKTKGPEFHPFLTTRTKWQIEDWVRETMYEVSLVQGYFDRMEFPKRTTACDDYGGCFFRDACRSDGWGNIERWLKVNTVRSVWDFMDPSSEEGTTD